MALRIHDDEILGVEAYAAELELLINGANQGGTRLDPRAALDLQKLLLSIDQSEAQLVKQHQRHVDDCLASLLTAGAPPPVRKICCACLVKLYRKGDTLPLYARVSSLQGFLSSKEALAKQTSELSRVGALEALATLSLTFGGQLGSSIPESVSIAAKQCYRGEPSVKIAALNLMAAAVEGLGDNDRNVLTVHAEALKTADKYAKDKYSDNILRCTAAGIYRAVGKVGGAGLWAYAGYAFDETARICVDGLYHTDRAVQDAYAVALGEIAAACKSSAADKAVAALQARKSGKVATLERLLAAGVDTCLAGPFIAAEAAGKPEAAAALAQAWLAYLAASQARGGMDEPQLVDLAVKLVNMLSAIGARSASGGEAELGAGIAGGELPHAQACVLYIVRTGIVEQLSETGQRLLLERVTAISRADAAPEVPTLAAALQLTTDLLEVLEEVDADTRLLVYEPVVLQLSSNCAAIRSLAATVLGALAAAEPSSAASMLADMMGKLSAAAPRLAAMRAPGKGEPPVSGSRGKAGFRMF